jgi:DinB family protein
VIHFRTRLLSLLGVQRDFPWGSKFDTGAKVGQASDYPDPDELLAMWEELSQLLLERMTVLTEADLTAPPGARVPSTDASLRGAIGYFSLHEAYHVGQMGYVRKWLGMTPIIDPPN